MKKDEKWDFNTLEKNPYLLKIRGKIGYFENDKFITFLKCKDELCDNINKLLVSL